MRHHLHRHCAITSGIYDYFALSGRPELFHTDRICRVSHHDLKDDAAPSPRPPSAGHASGGEEVGDAEGEFALGEVERVVAERVDEVVDGGLGVGFVGDGDDG